jgi:hypothetical protein
LIPDLPQDLLPDLIPDLIPDLTPSSPVVLILNLVNIVIHFLDPELATLLQPKLAARLDLKLAAGFYDP